MGLVSVVIPTYNRSTRALAAIESVLMQAYKPIEIIVVDDGSTDDTAQILKPYGSKIVYIYKENGGVSSARNIGIRASKGEYIAFLDSDDLWLEDKVEIQVDWFSRNQGFGLVLTDCHFVNSLKKISGQSNRRQFLPVDGHILEDVLLQPSLIPSTAMVRRSVLDAVGFFDEALQTAEDLDLHLRIAAKYQIGLIEKPLVYFRLGEEGLSQSDSTYGDYVHVVEQFLKKNPGICSDETRKNALYNVYLSASDGKYWRGECLSGFNYAISSLINASTIMQFIRSCKNLVKLFKYLGRSRQE